MTQNPETAPPRLYTLPDLAKRAGRNARSISFLVRQYETVTGQALPRRQRRNFMERVMNEREFELLVEVVRAYDKAPGEQSYLDLICTKLGRPRPTIQVEPATDVSVLAAQLAPLIERLEGVMDRLDVAPASEGGGEPGAVALRADAITGVVDTVPEPPQWLKDWRGQLEQQGQEVKDLSAGVHALTREVAQFRSSLQSSLDEVKSEFGRLARVIEDAAGVVEK